MNGISKKETGADATPKGNLVNSKVPYVCL